MRSLNGQQLWIVKNGLPKYFKKNEKMKTQHKLDFKQKLINLINNIDFDSFEKDNTQCTLSFSKNGIEYSLDYSFHECIEILLSIHKKEHFDIDKCLIEIGFQEEDFGSKSEKLYLKDGISVKFNSDRYEINTIPTYPRTILFGDVKNIEQLKKDIAFVESRK